MTKRILVVGERSREATHPWCDLPAEDAFRWLVNSRVLGAFCSSRSAALLAGKLSSVGVDLSARSAASSAATGAAPSAAPSAAAGSGPVCFDSLNLLPPDPRAGAWDPKLAREVADELRTRLYEAWLPSDSAERGDYKLDWGKAEWQRGTWRYSGVVLCGRRVVEAWDAAGMEFWSSDGGTLLVPHPSGLSREWNGLDVGAARECVERWVDQLPEV